MRRIQTFVLKDTERGAILFFPPIQLQKQYVAILYAVHLIEVYNATVCYAYQLMYSKCVSQYLN